MSMPERRAMVERPSENLSVRRQCALLNLARSGVYRPIPATCADDLAMMRRIDELHLKWPFYGSRRMVFELNQAGHGINRKRVQRLMRMMGIEALVPRPGTSKAAPGHKIYPYLLRGLAITEPNIARVDPSNRARATLHDQGISDGSIKRRRAGRAPVFPSGFRTLRPEQLARWLPRCKLPASQSFR